METHERCKGCRNYLTVPPQQPCSVCYKLNNPNQTGNWHTGCMLINSYENRSSSYNHYTAPYGQPPTYSSYYSPQGYGSSYYSQQHPVYSASYYRPSLPLAAAHVLLPSRVYGFGYYNQYNQHVHDQKRAVLCGVTYKGHPKTLSASTTNVRSMHQLLRPFGFRDGSIHILTEEESDPTKTPTKHNILMELKWLTTGSRSGDSLVFYYTGLGSHVPDYNGDENDKRDEAICPVDYRVSGKIVDDELL